MYTVDTFLDVEQAAFRQSIFDNLQQEGVSLSSVDDIVIMQIHSGSNECIVVTSALLGSAAAEDLQDTLDSESDVYKVFSAKLDGLISACCILLNHLGELLICCCHTLLSFQCRLHFVLTLDCCCRANSSSSSNS